MSDGKFLEFISISKLRDRDDDRKKKSARSMLKNCCNAAAPLNQRIIIMQHDNAREMKRQAEQVKHNFSIIIVDYQISPLRQMCNIFLQSGRSPNRAAHHLTIAYRNAETRL